MKIVVKDTSAQFLAEQLKRSKGIRLAAAAALTRTALKIKESEVELMQRKLSRPKPFTLNSLRVRPATLKTLEATVETKESAGTTPAGRVLSALVDGGTRRMKSSELQLRTQGTGSYWVPGEFAVLDQYGNIPGATLNKILSQLKLRRDSTQNATSSTASKAKRKSQAFFLKGRIVFLRIREYTGARGPRGGRDREDQTQPYLFLINGPRYKPILPFFQVAEETMDQHLALEYSRAFDEFTT